MCSWFGQTMGVNDFTSRVIDLIEPGIRRRWRQKKIWHQQIKEEVMVVGIKSIGDS